MGCEWTERPLVELIDNFDGLRVPVKQADRRFGPYPYYGASGVVDHVDRYLFDGEHLLVAEDGENLRTRKTPVAFLARGKFWVNNHAHVIRANGEADTRFLMYALSHADISGYLTGSTIPKLTQGNLNQIEILAPPLAEQRAIAHILGTLDDKIELNRRMSETLESMARALFKSWFVDFDPVRAKADGRDLGLPKHLADLFPSRLVAEFDAIADGWRSGPLSQWTRALSGGTPSKAKAEYWGGDIPWISPKAMMEVHVDDSDHLVTEQALGNGTKLAPKGACLVMVRGMGLHDRVRISQARREVAFNQDVKALVGEGIQEDLLLFALLDAQQELLLHVDASGHGTGRLSSDLLFGKVVTLPSLDVQDELSRPFQVWNARIGVCRTEARRLAAVRDTLLPQLVSGELRVEDTERFLENVAP